MIPTGVVCGDVWKIPPELKAKYDQQFYQLKPMNGFITELYIDFMDTKRHLGYHHLADFAIVSVPSGIVLSVFWSEQAKNLFLQSGLPSPVLAQIWALADRNGDGKMDLTEFTIAMHLIQMKLKGMELPKVLPPTLQVVTAAPVLNATTAAGFRPQAPIGVSTVPATVPASMAPLATGFIRPASPVDSKMQRSSSVSSQDSPTSGMPAPLTEWAVPQASKLKFTQMFNSYDRTRTGFLTGAQAKNILMSTGLSQPILAQIWSLADIDSDGRLSTEEFVLAMHLTEAVKVGDPVPRVLPPELIPPSHRRKRSGSVAQTSVAPSHASDVSLLGDLKDDKLLQQTTFEDKRRENFEKGQAELERRRLALLESQRKEQEERERKEREEMERRERIRQEQERRRQLELEKQLAKQRELEQEKEEQRRKALEQREAARREMERQRQLEWEKQRQQELLTQRQKEQEAVCHMKNRNKNLTYELEQLSSKIAELNEKIIETRKGVTDMKSSIDSMRVERDSKLNDMNEVKGKIKEMNDRLLIITQEKLSLKSQLQEVSQPNATSDAYSAVLGSFSNKQITIHRLKTSLDNIEKETAQKQKDIESSTSQLQQLKGKLDELVESHKKLYEEFEEKRQKVLALKKSRESGNGAVKNQASVERFDDVWGPSDTTNAVAEDWDAFGAAPAQNANTAVESEEVSKVLKYRTLYAFESRNPDELSIMPGDIILVPEGQSPEPGWLGGELHGKRGWFPEAYAELITDSTVETEGATDALADNNALAASAETVHIVGTEMKMTLEGISEAPENTSDVSDADKHVLQPSENSSFTQLPKSNQVTSPETADSPVPGESQELAEVLQAQALFPWKAKKENHLSFNKGDIIAVKEQQDMWWYGECNDKSGWFPKSYVKLISGPMKVNENAFENAFNDVSEPPDVSTNGVSEYYIATYAYQSQEPGDLCFQPGETIHVTKKEGEWWTGTIDNNRTGIFPSNYVRKLEPQEMPSVPVQEPEVKSESPVTFSISEGTKTLRKAEIVVVIAPYHASGPEQLTLDKGQLVQVRKKSPSGWWEGEVQVKGRKRQVGWFPASYVRPHTGSAASSARSTPEPILPKHSDFIMNGINQNSQTPGKCEQVVALYPFVGQHEDELSFQKGNIITLLNNSDPSWWKGELNGAVGLFPSNYVEFTGKSVPMPNKCLTLDSEAFSFLSSEERKRQQHIHELISTEESYMTDMSIVLDAFQKPLRESMVLTKDELRSIFVNWKDLIVCNTKLLRAMRVRRRMSPNGIIQMIGDILCENIPHLTPYIRFCSCQLNAASLIQMKTETDPRFKEVTKKCCTDPRTKGMPLSSFLLKPMQRITRYPLLIQKIQQHTPSNHPDFHNLEEAVTLAEQLCSQVNEGVRERENSDRLEWIQNHVSCEELTEQITFNSLTNCLGPRKLLHFGLLFKAKSGKELVAFLFNDFLLLTRPQTTLGKVSNVFQSERAMNTQYRMYKQPLFLNEISVKTSDAENNQEDSSFTVCFAELKIHLKTTPSEKQSWVKKLEQAASLYIETEKKNLNHQRTLRLQGLQGVGRLLVVVVEGNNLKGCTNGKSNPYCEVSMGSQEHKTKVVPNTLNPRWNASMQFIVKDLHQDVLCVSVFDRDLFSPNEFLGRTEIRVSDIYVKTHKTHEPVVKKLALYEVETGEVTIKLDLQIFENN